MHSNNTNTKRKNTSDNNESATKKTKMTQGPGIYAAIGKNLSGKIISHTANKPVAIVNPRCQDGNER
ncbi:hypothetical protein [Wolbachia endosymbiont of Folsomia candida]|uniref:hypothetical protein n=1 Tax=Wolbachia endosymbiont of Folsomia candida TaxID=169402 RepID=UPI000B5E3D66|nr:hypothetical protein [Wolbachia endosymbiont of Folsomia candida]APR98856.1 hypothetical protein ASM33_06570 [Wolbachia endosymbiont of Folsomia candida]